MLLLLLPLLLWLCPIEQVFSFAPKHAMTIHSYTYDYTCRRRSLSAKNIPKATNPAKNCEFELQELRAQFKTCLKQNIRPKMLSVKTRTEIETYMKKILCNCPPPIPLRNIANHGASVLHGNWTLVFASENASLGDLPRDSTVQILVYPNFNCDYRIQFEKSFGIKSLIAKSSYIVDSSPLNAGLVTIIYQDIVSDMFGFKSLPVGLFGMLKGRATLIETIWFDGKLWFERGYDANGVEYYNVYMKE
jgi:hypothetical protein